MRCTYMYVQRSYYGTSFYYSVSSHYVTMHSPSFLKRMFLMLAQVMGHISQHPVIHNISAGVHEHGCMNCPNGPEVSVQSLRKWLAG
jgi:hypothetical protein